VVHYPYYAPVLVLCFLTEQTVCGLDKCDMLISFFFKLNTYTYTYRTHSTFMNTSGLMLRFIKLVIKSVSLSIKMSPYIKKIISHKYSIHVKSTI
jgi:hypothetical protein